ncbi:energy transducer TonB [Glaciecola sp. SC05]|uniref:energy transducer TonB n=1 Tax=Glaciecola sp. SC05 TaxID=1987355 RepID=UPI00352984A0
MFIKAVSLIIVAILNFGCGSTEISSANNSVVNYKSRCEMQPKNEEDSINQSLVHTTPPKYPPEAAVKGLEGYVIIEYDISERGKPININVIESLPAKVFDKAAIYSFKGWQYQPSASKCHVVRLDFTLG